MPGFSTSRIEGTDYMSAAQKKTDGSDPSMTQFRHELDALNRYMQRVRQEVASINRPADEDTGFDSMSTQLEAIVSATEEATNTIMESVENNQGTIDELREGITDPGQLALLDKVSQSADTIFEACSFQDISGQRINKVLQSITYVETRIDTIIELWGKEAMDSVVVEATPQDPTRDNLVSGPQLDGDGLSQDDIDGLFD
jgi:chemotaxis protein CheZ